MILPYNFKDSGPHLTQDDILLLEKDLGVVLPPAFQNFLLQINGGAPENEVFIPETGPSFMLQRLFPIHGEMPFELRNMNVHGTDFPHGLLHIGMSVCGDALGLGVSADHFGKVYWQDHEIAESSEDWNSIHFLCDDFGHFLSSLKQL